MPRDGSANYTLPNGTLVNSGDTVLPSQHNPAMQDIAQALTGSVARSGVGGMLGDLLMNGYSVRNAGNIEATGTATVAGDLTGANLNVPYGNKVRAGDDKFFLQYVNGRPTVFLDASNNHYLQWAPDLNRLRLVLYGQVVMNVLPGAGGAIFLGPVVQNGSPT
jgi:hypothetical protein